MKANSGQFSAIEKRYLLADPGSRSGQCVEVLGCGHARTSALSKNGGKDKRRWCGICTKLASIAAKKPKAAPLEQSANGKAISQIVKAVDRAMAHLEAKIAKLDGRIDALAPEPVPSPPYAIEPVLPQTGVLP